MRSWLTLAVRTTWSGRRGFSVAALAGSSRPLTNHLMVGPYEARPMGGAAPPGISLVSEYCSSPVALEHLRLSARAKPGTRAAIRAAARRVFMRRFYERRRRPA